MRPVNWVVSAPSDVRVVLSPHEVNELLPMIRKSSVVRLHVYAPRVSLSMLSFSNLEFYSVPPLPKGHLRSGGLPPARVQLGLFAGQLYLSSYEEYRLLCAVLGLFVRSGNEDPSIEVESDGFIKPENRRQPFRLRLQYSSCKFNNTPIPALKDLVGLRRKGMKYLLTHVGKILHSRSLTPEDFQEASSLSEPHRLRAPADLVEHPLSGLKGFWSAAIVIKVEISRQ
ncbi:hypothetical protein FRC11_003631 [Ceratobasidium sp. 423]|nr:hypothetical protein FRC11_003631 [Ceratobasidium sp. 423]